jgi:hypothetical protein
MNNKQHVLEAGLALLRCLTVKRRLKSAGAPYGVTGGLVLLDGEETQARTGEDVHFVHLPLPHLRIHPPVMERLAEVAK